MRTFLRSIVFLICLLPLGSTVFAQNYPVQVTVVPTPPHRNYLNSFSEQGALGVYLTLLDFNAGPVTVRLKFKVDGPGYHFESLPNNLTYVLNPGQTITIDENDLGTYFSSAGQQLGFDPYKLPEGNTQICVDVLKAQTGEQLSNNGCGYFYMGYGQPALQVSPTCNSVIQPPQGMPVSTSLNSIPLQFNFIPAVAPIGLQQEVENTLYIYNWLGSVNTNVPQNPLGLALAMDPIPLGPLTSYTLLPADNILIEGNQYVWYVKTTLNGSVNQFQNSGWSAPCRFTYGQQLSVFEQLSEGLHVEWIDLTANSERKGTASWKVVKDDSTSQNNFNEFVLSYRKQTVPGDDEYEWFTDTVTSLIQAIYQLEPNTTYEAKVAGKMGTFVSEPTEIRTFTTGVPRTFTCGQTNLPDRASVFQPLEYADPGMKVRIGMFDLEFVTVESIGQAGHFSGTGLVPIDFLFGAEAKVRFDDLKIDKNFDVWEGTANVITDGLDNWLNEQYQQFQEAEYVNGVISSAYVQDSIAYAIVDGDTLSFQFPCPTCPVILNDVNGNQVTIYPNGVVKWGTYYNLSQDHLDVPFNRTVRFIKPSSLAGGFDSYSHAEWSDDYEIIKTVDNNYYFVPNQSLYANVGDYVTFSYPDTLYVDTIIQLECNGVLISPLSTNDSSGFKLVTFQIPGFGSGDTKVYAVVNGLRIGKLNLISFVPIQKTIKVVPVASNNFTVEQIASTLDKTLGGAIMDFDIQILPSFSNSEFTTSTIFSIPDASLLSKFSPQMRSLRDAYFDTIEVEDQVYYLFIVAGIQDSLTQQALDGYMPRGKNLGFIVASAPIETIAHELGHGIGGLKHSWQDNGPSKGSTDNLMDYSSSSWTLRISQWRLLRNPGRIGSIWDDEEEAAGASPMVYYFKVHLNPNGTVASRAYWKKEKYVRLYKDGNWDQPYYYEENITRPTVVNYVFNYDWSLNNSYKYKNVVYYRFEWKNNEWVRNIERNSDRIDIEGYDFPVWNVYTVFRYYRDYELISERIIGVDGKERDPAKLQADANAGMGVPHQAAKYLTLFVNSELNSIFADEEYAAYYFKVSDGYDVKLTIYDKRGWTESKIKTAEIVIHIDNAMSKGQVIDLLGEFGLKRDYSYDYYLWANEMPHTIARWANFQDQSLKDPPFVMQVFADILMGVPGAVYGFVTGRDWRTNEELTGWDYVLNSLELIPFAGAFAKTFKFGIKGIKIFGKSGKVLDLVQTAKKLPRAVSGQLSKLQSAGLKLVGEASDNMVLMFGKTGEQIVKFTDKGVKSLKNTVEFAGQGFIQVLDLGAMDFFLDGTYVQRYIRIFRNEDEIAVVVSKVSGAGSSLFKVDNALKSADELAGVLVNGSYLKNPTAKNVTDLIKNPSGAMKLDQSAGSILNGQYMYVIDETDNIIIGTRATGISPFNGKAPHPTLIGGVDPTVKTAGIIEFRAGKIYKVDNVSGHFKPSAQSLQNAQPIFNQKFAPNNFADDFQGFVPFTN